MNDTIPRRYHVHDDVGLLRSFASKQEAERYMQGTGYFLITESKPQREKPDLDAVGLALI